MKQNGKWVLVFAMFCMLVMPVFAQGAAEAKAEPRTLVVSTWGLSEDSLWSEVYEPFEKQYNVKVVLDTGNGQERYTKLLNDPNSTVDVIELAQKNVADGVAAGLFDPIKPEEVTDFASLIPAAQQIIKSGSGAPYTLNSIGIFYNPKAAGMEIKSWADLWDSRLKGKIAIPNITTTFGPAFVVMAGDAKGASVASDQGKTAFDALAALKPNVQNVYAKASDVANLFKNGEIAVAIIGDFGLPVVGKADPNGVYMVPSEGTYANFNVINIAKKTKNRDLAVAYINYRLNATTETRTAKVLNEAPVNSKVVLTPEVAANKTVGDVAAKAKGVDFTIVNPLMKDWVDKFNHIMSK